MIEVRKTAVDFDPFAEGEIAQATPLTAHQREIWSAILLGGEAANCAYNETVTLTLVGELDVVALAGSLTGLSARHEALRTSFSTDGTALVASGGCLPLERVDLRGESDPDAAYRALAQREVSTPFELARAPLARAILAELPGESRLLLRLHHIVCDGWSFGVLLAELGQLYAARVQGLVAELPPAPSFTTYARERAHHERSATAQAALAYWVEQFRELPEPLDLPLDFTRPTLRTYAASRVDHELPRPLLEDLRSFAKRQNASLMQVLLTAFQTLLARLGRQWEVVVGISAAGQAHDEQFGLVGHAVSFLPIRARLDPQRSFADALTTQKRILQDALQHQDVTFGTLLEHLTLARDASRIPLAPFSFNLEQSPAALRFGPLDARARNVARSHEAFELFANLVDRKDSLTIELQYNRELFDEQTVRDWLLSYQALLGGIVERPDLALAELPILADEQRRQILEVCNATETAFPRELPMHGFFEQRVDLHPERTALLFEQQSCTYRELEQRANRLAHSLQRQGVGPGQIVGVCVRRSIDMIVALLGVVKAGAAYLPLDPQYPAERLAHMLADADVAVVIARADSSPAKGADKFKVVLLDTEREQLAAESPSRVQGELSGDQLAYVIYTSGSTGKPKGVLLEHRNFANFLTGMDQRLTLAEGGVWLCATSISFDISVLEIFGALGRGFTVVVHSDESGPEHSLAELLQRHRVSHFQCTPSQARLLLDDPLGRAALGGLRELLLGGEALPADLAAELRSLLVRGRLLNMYGPTETTIWSTTFEVLEPARNIPIGLPIANTRVYVLDEHGNLCPPGAIGELYIGGSGVARGYHEQPELTRARFVPDPFSGQHGARMYKTGDLARFTARAGLEFLGRNDHQVKLRGYRIELGEVEAALRAHVAVRDAVVIAREDRLGDKRLVAYLVCEPTPTVQALKAFLSGAGLPEHMLPQSFVPLAKLPTTPNGKLDRRALPVPEVDTTLAVGGYVAPEGELERNISEVWCQVLALPRVGVEDNFFDLGGHSLLVVKLAQELQRKTGRALSVPDVFRFSTVKSLANHLRGGTEAAATAPQATDRRSTARRLTGRRG